MLFGLGRIIAFEGRSRCLSGLADAFSLENFNNGFDQNLDV